MPRFLTLMRVSVMNRSIAIATPSAAANRIGSMKTPPREKNPTIE